MSCNFRNIAGCASIAAFVACATGGVSRTKHYQPFDVVPAGFDDNGLPLNPEFGAQVDARCNPDLHAPLDDKCAPEEAIGLPDPSACSWVFQENSPKTRTPWTTPCTTLPVEADFSNVWTTNKTDLTCRDSELFFPGHVNFERNFGYAATYESRIRWKEYSGPFSKKLGDGDYNFALVPRDEAGLTPHSHGQFTLEVDVRELIGAASTWWRNFHARVQIDPSHAKEMVADECGDDFADGIATGLLGIDAEHGHMELHPLYAMALKIPCHAHETCGVAATETERLEEVWVMMARQSGNEGLCAHWDDHVHVLPLPDRKYTFRIPWNRAADDVEISNHTEFFTRNSDAVIEVHKDPKHRRMLVTIEIPKADIVLGELHLSWRRAGQPVSRPDACAFRQIRDHSLGEEGGEEGATSEGVREHLTRIGVSMAQYREAVDRAFSAGRRVNVSPPIVGEIPPRIEGRAGCGPNIQPIPPVPEELHRQVAEILQNERIVRLPLPSQNICSTSATTAQAKEACQEERLAP